jgi:hypothetical protein
MKNNSRWIPFTRTFRSSTPSCVTRGDVCGYRTCSMLMAKVLFDRENSKDKNRRRCFQGYQGDIGCPTRESSRTIVFNFKNKFNVSSRGSSLLLYQYKIKTRSTISKCYLLSYYPDFITDFYSEYA